MACSGRHSRSGPHCQLPLESHPHCRAARWPQRWGPLSLGAVMLWSNQAIPLTQILITYTHHCHNQRTTSAYITSQLASGFVLDRGSLTPKTYVRNSATFSLAITLAISSESNNFIQRSLTYFSNDFQRRLKYCIIFHKKDKKKSHQTLSLCS